MSKVSPKSRRASFLGSTAKKQRSSPKSRVEEGGVREWAHSTTWAQYTLELFYGGFLQFWAPVWACSFSSVCVCTIKRARAVLKQKPTRLRWSCLLLHARVSPFLSSFGWVRSLLFFATALLSFLTLVSRRSNVSSKGHILESVVNIEKWLGSSP